MDQLITVTILEEISWTSPLQQLAPSCAICTHFPHYLPKFSRCQPSPASLSMAEILSHLYIGSLDCRTSGAQQKAESCFCYKCCLKRKTRAILISFTGVALNPCKKEIPCECHSDDVFIALIPEASGSSRPPSGFITDIAEVKRANLNDIDIQPSLSSTDE